MVDRQDDEVTLGTFPSRTIALLALGRLEQAGIEGWLRADDAGGAYPVLQGVLGVALCVRRADLERAESVLDEAPSDDEAALAMLAESSAEPPREAPTSGRRGWVGVVLGLGVGIFVGLAIRPLAPASPQRVLGGRRTATNDRNGDGVADQWMDYNGLQLVEVRDDDDFDGKPDQIYDYEGGNVVRGRTDTDFDGTIDTKETFEQGEVSIREEDLDEDGRPDITTWFEHNRPVRVTIHPGGGPVIAEGTYSGGLPHDYRFDPGPDGRFRKHVLYGRFGDITGIENVDAP